jgi:hypothetical protein
MRSARANKYLQQSTFANAQSRPLPIEARKMTARGVIGRERSAGAAPIGQLFAGWRVPGPASLSRDWHHCESHAWCKREAGHRERHMGRAKSPWLRTFVLSVWGSSFGWTGILTERCRALRFAADTRRMSYCGRRSAPDIGTAREIAEQWPRAVLAKDGVACCFRRNSGSDSDARLRPVRLASWCRRPNGAWGRSLLVPRAVSPRSDRCYRPNARRSPLRTRPPTNIFRRFGGSKGRR